MRLLRSAAGAVLAAAALTLTALAGPAAATLPPAVDPAFGDGGTVVLPDDLIVAQDVAGLPDGGAVVVGFAQTGGGHGVLKLAPDGRPDPAFGGGDGFVTLRFGESGFGAARGVALDAAGRVVIRGDWEVAGRPEIALARLLPDGTLDPSFDGDGLRRFSLGDDADQSSCGAMALTPAGQIGLACFRAGAAAAGRFGVVLTTTGTYLQPPGSLAWIGDRAPEGIDSDGGDGFLISGRTNISPSLALLGRATVAFAPVAGFPAPLVQDLSYGNGENGVVSATALPGGRVAAVGSLKGNDSRRYGAVLVAGPSGERSWEWIPGPGTASLDLQQVVADGAGLLAVGGVDRRGAGSHAFSPVVAFLTADGRPDAARGGVRDVDAAPAGARIDWLTIRTAPGGRAFALTEVTDGENVQWSGLVRIALAPQPPDPVPGPPRRDPPPGDPPRPGPLPGDPPPGGRPVAQPRRAPLAAFSRPPAGRPVRALGGTVASGARRVEVALLLRSGRRCRALTRTRPAFGKAGACRPSRWSVASGRGAWRLRFGRALPRGRYVAYVRAVAPGTRAWPFTTEGGNKLAFTVRR